MNLGGVGDLHDLEFELSGDEELEEQPEAEEETATQWVLIKKLPVGPALEALISRVNAFGGTFGLTPYDWQAKTSAAVLAGHDVCIARTGDEKSAVFQLLACGSKTCHIVISPLIGLIDVQVSIASSSSKHVGVVQI